MIDQQTIAFIAVAAALTIYPGADTFLVLRNVLQGSRRDGIVTTLGICSGLFVHATLSAFGLSLILFHSSFLFNIVKTAGACYLLWLGFQSFLRMMRHSNNLNISAIDAPNNRSLIKHYLEGFLSNILNPKVIIFYLAFLPQFIGPSDSVLIKSLFLAGIHYTMGIVWLIILSIFFDFARRFIIKSSFRRWVDGVCGTMLMGFGIRLFLERR